MNSGIIELNFGARYQVIDNELYSLNYAEKGMFGETFGKVIPKNLAEGILDRHKQEKSRQITVRKSDHSIDTKSEGETDILNSSVNDKTIALKMAEKVLEKPLKRRIVKSSTKISLSKT